MFFTAMASPVYIVHASERGLITINRDSCTTRVAVYKPETIGLVPNLRDGGWAIVITHSTLQEAIDYGLHMAEFYDLPTLHEAQRGLPA